MKRVNHVEVNLQEALDLNTVDGDIAWDQFFDHHAIQVCRGARFRLRGFWVGAYEPDPYIDRDVWLKEAGLDTKKGLLGVLVAEYIRQFEPDFDDWDSVVLFID